MATASAGSGCASMNNTEKGAAGGAVVGTAAGTAIGALTGRPLLGAGLGAAAGTATGALIGNQADKDEARHKDIVQAQQLANAQAAAQAQAQRMGIADVISLSQQKQSDQVIINQIRTTRSTFQLTLSDLEMLKNNGVSQAVIAEMQASPPTPGAPPVVVAGQPNTVIYESGGPAVVVRPAPIYVAPRPYGYYYGGGYYYRRW
jgi:hypothetical protein